MTEALPPKDCDDAHGHPPVPDEPPGKEGVVGDVGQARGGDPAHHPKDQVELPEVPRQAAQEAL